MAEKKGVDSRVNLPIPLNEFGMLSPLEAAQLYTLHALEWAEEMTDEKNLNLKTNFLGWLRDFNSEGRVPGPIGAYNEVLKSANRIIPFIKSDVQRMLKKGNGLGYSSTMTDNNLEEPSNVFEADTFLYEDIDEPLAEQGQESEIQCVSCKSTDCSSYQEDIKIDKSTAVASLAKLFTLLENDQMAKEYQVLVIGSGIGSFTYGAFLFFSRARAILSYEWEQKLWQLQEEVIKRHGMTEKVTVVNDVYPQDFGVIKSSDLVIISSKISKLTSKQIGDIFQTLKNNLKPGSLVVTCSEEMQVYLMQLERVEIEEDLRDWVKLKYQLGDTTDRLDYDNFNSDSLDFKLMLNYYIYTVM